MAWRSIFFIPERDYMPGHRVFLSLRTHRTIVLSFFWLSPLRVFFSAPRDQLAVVFASVEHLYKTVATYFLFFCEDRWRIHACARRNAA